MIDGQLLHVLDASAVLAFFFEEPGRERVLELLPGCGISSVNWAEIVQKADGRGMDVDRLRGDVEELGALILPFDAVDAEEAAALWSVARAQRLNLSLADRACLATARRLGVAVVTADRAWGELELGTEVLVVR